MDGWSPARTATPDLDPSSSEGEYMLEPGRGEESRDPGNPEGPAERGAEYGGSGTAPGFRVSGIGERKVVLGRVGPRDDKELKYLHLLWDPDRNQVGAAVGGASRPGKMTGNRARRQNRTARSLGPIGRDVYGEGRA